MKIGAMNNPGNSLYSEIEWIGKNGFDFIDITTELPGVDIEKINVGKVKSLLKKYKLGVVGHTAWYHAFRDPQRLVREAATKVLKKEIQFLGRVGSKNANVHLMPLYRFFSVKDGIKFYSDVLKEASKFARKLGMVMMVEHIAGSRSQFDLLQGLFKKVPDLKFHLDVGHANLETKGNKTKEFLRKFSKKLEHIHMSDNDGTDDQPLPLGAGNINWTGIVNLLMKYKYDGTITLKIFSKKSHLINSKNKFKKLWKSVR